MKQQFVRFVALLFLLNISFLAHAQSPTFTELTQATLPWDAVPSPDGEFIYFTASNDQGLPGVFSVPAEGGDVVELASGKPFVMPLGIAISEDGQTLYIADPWSAGSDGNGIFSLSIADGTPVLIQTTSGTEPKGVEVSGDQIYFTGINPENGEPAVYQLDGETLALRGQGAPLIAPSGITIAQDGTIYVLDRLASGSGLGGVIRIQGDKVELIVEDVRTGGQLAGLTLTLDQSLLLVSSLDSTQGTAQVLVVDLASMQTSIVNDVIGQNTAAGGLHRAHNVNIFAWADSTAGPRGGKVYSVGF